ncbi:MAG: PilN domain-containing protein [Desulfuromonadales bacterium]|nr:PilN domain-containing protein [Desulfuromonadales bacterium]
MIKINLLPVRAAKKKETAVQQISIFFFGLVLVLAIAMTMFFVKRLQISDTKNDISTANNKINDLKSKIGKLEELKTLKEQVKKKLDVLNQLRKNKTGPAQRLAILSDSAPDQLWLTSYTETNADIKMSGLAFNEEMIANFMRSLEASTDYAGVELLVSEQKESEGVKYKRFDITCKLRSSVEASKSQQPAPLSPAPATHVK